jgi:K+-sensing histidine kinase KdpD
MTYKQLGLDPELTKPSIQQLTPHLENRLTWKLVRCIITAVRKKEPQILQLQIDKGGKSQAFSIRIVPEIENGRVTRIIGSNLEITQLVQQEKKEKEIIQSLLDLSSYTDLSELAFESFIEYLLQSAIRQLSNSSAQVYFKSKNELGYSLFKSVNSGDQTQTRFIAEAKYPSFFENLRAKRTLVIDNVQESTILAEFDQGVFRKTGSLVYSQIIFEGNIVGMLCLENQTPKKWTYSEQRYVASLADIVSMAYGRETTKKLENEKANLIDSLILKNQDLEEFTYVISRSMGISLVCSIKSASPIICVKGARRLWEVTKRIYQSALDLDNVIKELNTILHEDQRIASKHQKVNLYRLFKVSLQKVSEEFSGVAYESKINFSEDTQLLVSRSLLSSVFNHLLHNSFKYRKPDKNLLVEVHFEELQDYYRISFIDNGLGIDLNRFKHKIFKLYQRFHLEVEGRGIGLFYIKNQLNKIGGDIEVDSKPNQGTQFTVLLPRIAEVVSEKKANKTMA